MDDKSLRKILMWVLWGYELIVIVTCLLAGVALARSQGGELFLSLPLILIAAAELLRIPLSAWSTRLPFSGQILAFFVLLAIAVGSFEGLSLAFEQFVNNRVVRVMEFQHEVSNANDILVAKKSVLDDAELQLKIAESEREKIMVALKGLRENQPQSLVGKDSRAERMNARTNRIALSSHLKQIESAQIQERAAIDKVEAAVRRIEEIKIKDITPAVMLLNDARNRLDIEKRLSPMHRLSASIFNTKMENLTEDQFEEVKKYAVFGLAGAFSILSMLVSIVAHTTPKSENKSGGNFNRLMKSILASRRRTLIIQEPSKFVEGSTDATRSELNGYKESETRSAPPLLELHSSEHHEVQRTEVIPKSESGHVKERRYVETYNSLPDSARFERSSHALFIGCDGSLTFAPNNMIPFSNEFDHNAWGKIKAIVQPSNDRSPTGNSAWKLVEDRNDGAHLIISQKCISRGQRLIASIYAKAQERSGIILEVSDLVSGSVACKFDLIAGKSDPPNVTTKDYSDATSDMIALGDAWYRCSIIFTKCGGSTQNNLLISVTNGVNHSYAGDGQSGLFISGAQLEAVTKETFPRDYLETREKCFYGPRFEYDSSTKKPIGLLLERESHNLLNFSEKFHLVAEAQSDWIGVDLLSEWVEDFSPSHIRGVLQITAINPGATLMRKEPVGMIYQRVLSVWLRRVTGQGSIEYTLNGGQIWSNIIVGSNWIRHEFPPTTDDHRVGFRINEIGDAIEVWGAQLENGSSATSYIPTETVARRRAADHIIINDGNSRVLSLTIFDSKTKSEKIVPYESGKTLNISDIWLRGIRYG